MVVKKTWFIVDQRPVIIENHMEQKHQSPLTYSMEQAHGFQHGFPWPNPTVSRFDISKANVPSPLIDAKLERQNSAMATEWDVRGERQVCGNGYCNINQHAANLAMEET